MPSVSPALVSLEMEMEMGDGIFGEEGGFWRGVWASTRRRRMARGEGGGEGRS